MATIVTLQTESTEVEVTADYCFGQAAKHLQSGGLVRQDADLAREWRALGEAISNTAMVH